MGQNTFKNKELNEDLQEQLEEDVEEKAEETQEFIKSLMSDQGANFQYLLKYVPFVCYVVLLIMLYISNKHFAERTVRSIDKLSKEVKELGWDNKSLSAELMKMSTQTEIAKRVDSVGLKERLEPPIKIEVLEEKAK